MKISGKSNAKLAGMDPLTRHAFERFGDDYERDFAPAVQFVGFTKAMTSDLESDADPVVRARADGWWNNHILPRLQIELRKAIESRDGSFFRAVANAVESRGQRPVDPLREWICRTFFNHVSNKRGSQTVQTFGQDKTARQLYALFKSDYVEASKGDTPRLDVFRRALSKLGVKWKITTGRPARKKPGQ